MFSISNSIAFLQLSHTFHPECINFILHKAPGGSKYQAEFTEG